MSYPSDVERRRLERFPEQIAVEDLRASFALSDSDRALVFVQRGAASRLGLAVQLCAYLGSSQDTPETANRSRCAEASGPVVLAEGLER